MKKLLLVFIAATLLSGCSLEKTNKTTALSQIKVEKRAHSKDWKRYWIEVKNPNANNIENKGEYKIYVDDHMVWNLIKVGQTYTAEYEKRGGEDYKLTQILYPEDSDKYLNKE